MEEIVTDDAPTFGDAPLSQAIIDDNKVYVAGQLGVEPDTGELVSEDITEQTEQTFDNIEAVLEAAGSSTESVVKTTVFLSDLEYYDEVNDVYRERLSTPYPARSAIAVKDLVVNADVEIELIANVE